MVKHGGARRGAELPEYRSWRNMLKAVRHPELHRCPPGTKVCERWMKFEHFLADMGRRPISSCILHRKENAGDYEPSNCRWVTRSEWFQDRNLEERLAMSRKGALVVSQQPYSKHNHTSKDGYRSSEYRSWEAMWRRVRSPKCFGFHRYGGRGIKVCERWLDFRIFFADMGPKPSPAHTIDRVNNDGDYEPGNCRWATPKQQSHNRRR